MNMCPLFVSFKVIKAKHQFFPKVILIVSIALYPMFFYKIQVIYFKLSKKMWFFWGELILGEE